MLQGIVVGIAVFTLPADSHPYFPWPLPIPLTKLLWALHNVRLGKMTANAAASVAALAGLGAYINAKYHIGQDLRQLKFKGNAEKHYVDLGESYLVLRIKRHP